METNELHESEVVREVTAMANATEQAEQIRTAAEALVLKLKDFEYEEWAGNPEISFADFVEVELTALKEALSRGWLSRVNRNPLEVNSLEWKTGVNTGDTQDDTRTSVGINPPNQIN